MRTTLIKKYLTQQEVYAVIGHHILVYIKIICWYALILIAVSLLHALVIRYVTSHIIVTWIASIAWVVIYAKWLYEFIDEYLDALVVTDMWLVFFRWNWLFSYKTLVMQWISIETVTNEQNTFMDTVFKKGDISIRLEEEMQYFSDVYLPAQQVAVILNWKERLLWTRSAFENEPKEDIKDKYELLVEALGEVVSEYVEKKERDQ